MSRMLELRPDEIHLWQAFPDSDPHPALREEYGELLSAEEREREARFRFEHDRHRFRVTRALARQVLGGYLGIDPRACEFTANEHGRPALAGAGAGAGETGEAASGRAAPLQFNLSHTRDLVVLAVTRGREIGVDVERLRGARRTVDLAARFFADFESERVANASEPERDDLFYQFWTLKESYIKARGLGLAIPLGKFGFRLAAESPVLWTHADLGDDAGRWAFVQLKPTPEHRLAICVSRGPGPAPTLVVRDFARLALGAHCGSPSHPAA
jgi:4'-phosphopantetheinyl transferase